MSDSNDTIKGGDGGTPTTPSGASSKVQLTDREQEILSKAWNCMKVQPEIDYNRLAAATGMTNPRSASNAWSALKKKLFNGTPPVTPAKAKAAAAAVEGGDSEKKRKRATPKKKVTKTEGDGDDMDAVPQETPVKKKRTPAKKKPAAPASNTEDSVTEAPAAEAPATEATAIVDKQTDVKTDDEAMV
ncbi:hypothetical protein ACHAQA_003920 [Verticillium albo-atrum]